MVRGPKTVGFKPQTARRLRKNAGGTHIETFEVDTRPRGASGSGGAKLVKATGGIAARSGVTLGSATCTEYKITGSDLETNTETIEVFNLSLLAIPVDAFLIAVLEQISGKWIAQAVINGLRFE